MSEKTILQSKVKPAFAGRPLLDYVSGRFRYQNRDYWEKMIEGGDLTLNGQKATPQTELRAGDRLAYAVVLNEPKVDTQIQILHEEEGFLVAEKPGWLPSHADGNFIKNTFIYLVQKILTEKGYGGKAHLVHRLDRETSGLMVVAKTKDALRHLTRQFEAGQVKKEYQALVQGVVEKDSFEIDGAIGRDPHSQISMRRAVVPAGSPGAQQAATQFQVIQRLPQTTLMLCQPRTGRTGQIRVHLASMGYPVVNDKLYGRTDDQFLEFVRDSKAGLLEKDPGQRPRHLLHASRLEFSHPATGRSVSFQSELPKDMKSFLESK
jgi:RluA family pseudouridine synthase